MYNSYFGFREKPFKLVPNPDYLYLSKSHEIALAHLTYATDQGEGFVVITGEAGTGKTTLCRNYLEGLDDRTSSAYIFNPRLDSSQLLASICAEFGIATAAMQIKTLLDKLNSYLIAQNSLGFKVVLLIDEAQGLSIENLELVRMMSNLETTRSKLLQIILVGQPELGDKLDSYELRQLAQRISLNYHLSPLTAKEAEAYIYHRLGIATKRQAVHFSANACRAAYHYSGGIPRLINIVCDRALLLAFSINSPKVTKGIMQSAIRELLRRGKAKRVNQQPYMIGGVALLVVAAVAMALFIWRGGPVDRRESPAAAPKPEVVSPASPHAAVTFKIQAPIENEPASSDVESPLTVPSTSPSAQQTEMSIAGAKESPTEEIIQPETAPVDDVAQETAAGPSKPGLVPIDDIIAALDYRTARKEAVSALLSIWQQPRPNPNLLPDRLEDAMFYDLAARQYGLRSYATQWNWALLKRLDLPVILALRQNGTHRNVYLTLIGESQGRLQFSQGAQAPAIETDLEAIVPYIAGPVYLFWRNAFGFDMLIGHGANRNAVLGVKHLLRQIGYHDVPQTPEFDAYTQDMVKTFQARNELVADGLVGPLTKIMLLREADTHGMPHLSGRRRGDS